MFQHTQHPGGFTLRSRLCSIFMGEDLDGTGGTVQPNFFRTPIFGEVVLLEAWQSTNRLRTVSRRTFYEIGLDDFRQENGHNLYVI